MTLHRHTATFLRNRFSEAGLRPVTKYGQNFLIDLNLQRVLVDAAQLDKSDVVLEVGTGTGAVTAQAASLAAEVITVEIDPLLFQLAREELEDFENVTMLQQDALKNKNNLHPHLLETIAERMAARPGSRLKLVANLPYNIATPVISNLLSIDTPPAMMSVTIQKELADRISSTPGTKDYGALSVWVQSQCRTEVVRVMPPSVFWPRPKVHSAILRIRPDEDLRSRIGDPKFFHKFARAMFFHRRKFLRANILGAFKGQLDKPEVDELMEQLGLGPESRSENLDVPTMLRLSDAVQQKVSEA